MTQTMNRTIKAPKTETCLHKTFDLPMTWHTIHGLKIARHDLWKHKIMTFGTTCKDCGQFFTDLRYKNHIHKEKHEPD